jgi:hypothetical protein
MTAWTRWWPLTGVAFVALWIVTFAITDNDVDNKDPDAKIVAYYDKSSNQNKHIIALFLILAAGLLFIWFLAQLRARLIAAEGGAGTLAALAYGAGIASVALWLVADVFFASPALAKDETSKFQLDANTYRLYNDTGYAAWVAGTTVALIVVVATAVIALRTGLLPKWIAWLSFPVALTMLVSFFFIPFLIMLGWILVVSVTLIVRREAPAAAAELGLKPLTKRSTGRVVIPLEALSRRGRRSGARRRRQSTPGRAGSARRRPAARAGHRPRARCRT